ncbi:MAG: hypothetical protein ACRCV5_12485 [Afipia sp.]
MKFNVFGLVVPVIKEKGLSERGFAGYYDPMKKQIKIDPNQKGLELTHTVLHELGHTLFDRCGILQSKIPPELVEVIVENYATMLVENFRVTPKIK